MLILASPRDTRPPPAAPPLVITMAYFNIYCQILRFPVREQKMWIKRQKAAATTQKSQQNLHNLMPITTLANIKRQGVYCEWWMALVKIVLTACMVLCLTRLTITKSGSWLLRVAHIRLNYLWYPATLKKARYMWYRARGSRTGFRSTTATQLGAWPPMKSHSAKMDGRMWFRCTCLCLVRSTLL